MLFRSPSMYQDCLSVIEKILSFPKLSVLIETCGLYWPSSFIERLEKIIASAPERKTPLRVSSALGAFQPDPHFRKKQASRSGYGRTRAASTILRPVRLPGERKESLRVSCLFLLRFGTGYTNPRPSATGRQAKKQGRWKRPCMSVHVVRIFMRQPEPE